jgi:hypothetical protein
MPTISLPPRSELASAQHDYRTGHPAPSLVLRTHVAAHRRSLTYALSEGANPTSSPALTLRANQLTSDRSRRTLARSLRRTVHEALHPVPRRVAFGIVRRGAVIDSADAIDVLVKRLHSPEPIAAEGAALIQRMLSDGAWSPLYSATPGGTMRRLVVLATAALEPADMS